MKQTRFNWQIKVKHPLSKRWRNHSVVPHMSKKYVAKLLSGMSKEWLGVKAAKI